MLTFMQRSLYFTGYHVGAKAWAKGERQIIKKSKNAEKIAQKAVDKDDLLTAIAYSTGFQDGLNSRPQNPDRCKLTGNVAEDLVHAFMGMS